MEPTYYETGKGEGNTDLLHKIPVVNFAYPREPTLLTAPYLLTLRFCFSHPNFERQRDWTAPVQQLLTLQ